MMLFTREHLESLKKGDKFETPSPFPGMDVNARFQWEFVHRGKTGTEFYFDVYQYDQVMITSVMARITPRGVVMEEMQG